MTRKLPGLVNTHSHAFQRAIRGVAETRGTVTENFWSWRAAMYRAANGLNPDELYRVARMAYLEMALSGITTVGEFHYVHRDAAGQAYADPNETSMAMVRAAQSVGLRICLLRCAYARAGSAKEEDPLQKRFIEPTADEFLRNVEALRNRLDGNMAWVGVAPHSVRAVPLGYLREVMEWADREQVPVHMHVAEQPLEVEECRWEYGTTPVAFLAREGFLSKRFAGVHGIHVTADEIGELAKAEATICACPTTERNLGDGILAAYEMRDAGVRLALGTDSQAQIDLLEDARELDYHLRLKMLERAILNPLDLFLAATSNGALALSVPPCGEDYFTVDMRDVSIAGVREENFLPTVVYGLNRTAVQDVVVDGKRIVEGGRHPLQEEVVDEYLKVELG